MLDSPILACLQATVHGRVTGVNFRGNTLAQAQSLCLTGWVRNNPDGTVGILARGPREALETLLQFLHIGPPAAKVTRVEFAWRQEANRFTDFNIIW